MRGTGVPSDWHQHQSEGPDFGDIIHIRNELTANWGVELGGFHGSNWFISSPRQLLYYLTSFGLPVDPKSVSPSSVSFILTMPPSFMSVSLKKLFHQKWTFVFFQNLLLLFFISSLSASLLSTHPVCTTLAHTCLCCRVGISVPLSPTFPRYAFSVLAATQETCQNFIVFINIVYFKCLEWRPSFADLKYGNRFHSLLCLFCCTPPLTAKTGAGVCARPGASSWINTTLTAVVCRSRSVICCLIDASFARRFLN